MPWRWTNLDARPVSDYLYNYYESRKPLKFLYYCRECIRNFDVAQRVGTCPKCGNTSIIELPKASGLERRCGSKGYGMEDLKADFAKACSEFAAMLDALLLAVWRAKIAAYYFLTPMPDELK